MTQSTIDSELLTKLKSILDQAEPYMKHGVEEDWPAFIATVQSLPKAIAQEANKADGCPCLLVEPCSYACSCARPIMSGGCMRCAKYGSKEQRLKAAQRLAQLTAEKGKA